jgi:DNA-binding NtrC family response regulator
MVPGISILIVSCDATSRDRVAEVVRRCGFQPVLCPSLSDARALIARGLFQCVFCSDTLPDCNLASALEVLSAETGGTPVIVLSHVADWEACLKALNAGAFDYVACPPDALEAERILRVALGQTPRQPRKASGAAA